MTVHTIKYANIAGTTTVYLECNTERVNISKIVTTGKATTPDGKRDIVPKPRSGVRITIPEVYSVTTTTVTVPHPNLITDSNAYGTPACWAKHSLTIGDSISGPDAVSDSGIRLTDSDIANAGSIYSTVAIPANALSYTFSIFLKDGVVTTGVSWLYLQLFLGGSAINQLCVFDWTTHTATGGSVEYWGNGWWRVSVTKTNDGTRTLAAFYLYPDGWQSDGSGTGYVYADGAQFEQAAAMGKFYRKIYGVTTLSTTTNTEAGQAAITKLKTLQSTGIGHTLTLFGEVFLNTYIERLIPRQSQDGTTNYDIVFIQDTGP
jgi:hypothetical protein